MNAELLVNPMTYIKIESREMDFAVEDDDGNRLQMKRTIDPSVPDQSGYIVVDGKYVGSIQIDSLDH